MRARRGIVSLDGRRVGTLAENESRSTVTFAYDDDYLAAAAVGAVSVSLTLPLGEGPWTTSGLHPFFAGLLPEGWLHTLAVAKLRVGEHDQFGMLVATGADCIGAVEIRPDPAA